MRGRPTPARRARTGGEHSFVVAAVASLSVGLCSAQWGCSLAVNLDGLAVHQQDGSPPETASNTDLGVGPEAPPPPDPMDAHDRDAAGAGRDSQMADGEEHGRTRPGEEGASDAMPVVADAGATREEKDAGAPDMPGERQDADAPDVGSGEPDAAPGDTIADLSTAGDVEAGSSTDATSADGGEGDAHPVACAPSHLVSTTLELANALSGPTACGYVPSEVPRFYAAVDSKVFDGSAACGACVIIETPAATVEARIVDLGPSPSPANPTAVAVSRAAIRVLAPDGSTLVTQGVDWHFAPCALSSPGMTFKIQKGSNASYAGVLIENHRYRLTKVEYKVRATYYALSRSTYNYWIAPEGMGTGPFTLRMTDELGQTVEQTGIPLTPEAVFKGQAQFPVCSP